MEDFAHPAVVVNDQDLGFVHRQPCLPDSTGRSPATCS